MPFISVPFKGYTLSQLKAATLSQKLQNRIAIELELDVQMKARQGEEQ